MAFDHTGFFTIVGKYVKAINIWNGYISAITTAKNEIRDAYEAEDLHDIYGSLPPIIAGFQGNVSQIIASLVTHMGLLITDRDYTVEQIPSPDFDVASILDSLHRYMQANSVDIKTSVVSLDDEAGTGPVDQDFYSSNESGTAGASRLFVGRTLDGVNSPGNGVRASVRYAGLESQLAKSTTVYAEVISNAVTGREVVQLYSLAQETQAYQVQQEEPGVGPTLSAAESGNLIGTNWNFTTWTGNNPDGWSLTGGVAGTDWADSSGSGAGPLKILTDAVKVTRKLTSNLAYNTMYFIACSFRGLGSGVSTIKLTVRNNAASINYLVQQSASSAGSGVYNEVYGFFYVPEGSDLDDIYVELEYDEPAPAAGIYADVRKVVLIPAVYYNGLAWAWWCPVRTAAGIDLAPLEQQSIVVVSNSNGGVFQTFFRKAFFVQLPTADSPSIADSLAT